MILVIQSIVDEVGHVWLMFVVQGGNWAGYNGDDVVSLSFRPPSSGVGREVRGGGLAYVCRNSKEAC